MNYQDYRHILFERREPHILWMTLNRPDVLNAADARLHTELVEVWKTIDRDPWVHAAVVTGAVVSRSQVVFGPLFSTRVASRLMPWA